MAVLQEAVSSAVRLGDGEPGGRRRIGRGVLLPLGFAVLATVAWEILCRVTRISPLLLPPPSAVWTVLSENYEILFQHALPTTIETVVSFGLATLLGVALAVAAAVYLATQVITPDINTSLYGTNAADTFALKSWLPPPEARC